MDVESQKTMDEVVDRFKAAMTEVLAKAVADLQQIIDSLDGWTVTSRLSKPVQKEQLPPS